MGGRRGPKSEPPGAASSEPRVWLEDQNRWGVGEYDEASGLYESYENPDLSVLSLWRDHRDLVEADLHEVYGIDTGSGILRERTWKWFCRRVSGLLTCECRIQRKLAPPEKTKKPSAPHARRR